VNSLLRRALQLAAIAGGVAGTCAAQAHSASDAYLTLDVETQHETGVSSKTVMHGQWDIALRDLDFVLKLDKDGDGNITWGELREQQPAIRRYVFPYLHLSGDNRACTVIPTRELVDNHADGAYAALFFDVVCPGAPAQLTLDYRLFFHIDPSHRGIFMLRSGTGTATALMSPDNARVELTL
jgi:hypothetical protein